MNQQLTQHYIQKHTKEVIETMGSLKENAETYEPAKQIKNIAELETVSIDLVLVEENDAEFPYKYIEVNAERYRVPLTVLEGLKTMLKEKPNMLHFKVNKEGTGLNTKYQVIPL